MMQCNCKVKRQGILSLAVHENLSPNPQPVRRDGELHLLFDFWIGKKGTSSVIVARGATRYSVIYDS
jgi:hypothetical protein